MVAASTLPIAPVKEGDVLAAKYRIENVIGVGGMGVVVAAMHLELEKRVALKFLLPQAQESDELIGRFTREAKASVKLKGAHVARTFDVGHLDDGRAYIVMEYLEGRDLGQEIKSRTGDDFAIVDAVSWILQACEGLAEAHALGIVHRDLKPANLFLQRRASEKPFVKVLDFGISKSINPSSSDHLSLTKTEMLLGSPLYMAPEQMRSSKYVDERSDIWSLGAVAYQLLTGRVPFEAETLLDLCFRVAQEECVPPLAVRSEIPAKLSAAIMRCLEKDPEKRFGDVGELSAALEPFGPAETQGTAERIAALLHASDPNARPRAEAYVPAEPRSVASHEPSRLRAPLMILFVGVAVLALSYVAARSQRTTPAPPPPPSPARVVVPDVVAPVVPVAEPVAPAVVSSAPAAPPVVYRPRPKPLAAPAPSSSSGFLKVRE